LFLRSAAKGRPSGPDRATPQQIESIMNPRQTQEQIGLFPATTQAQAKTQTGSPQSLLGVIGQALAVIGSALASWPERRATYEKLRRLTDRELADIGIARGDITRVFEPDFRLPAPANANAAEAQKGWRAA
jgi:uncharacterized protein YjiS (DUF1127 family)